MVQESPSFRRPPENRKISLPASLQPQEYTPTNLNQFHIIKTVGEGSFGTVKLAKDKITDNLVAIKMLSKQKLVKLKQVKQTTNEKKILESVHFPFLVNYLQSFQDLHKLYIVLDYVGGGDIFYYLCRVGRCPEGDAQFLSAQVILAFEYLHNRNIIYRDLKPENVLLGRHGYVKITDFGTAKVVTGRTYTLCGTPEYIAPEIILSKGYGKAIDWWTLGILIYELVSGSTPFYSKNTMSIYEKIVGGKIPHRSYFSREVRHLIQQLLQCDCSKRFGNLRRGVTDIKQHPWFGRISWEAMLTHQVPSPILNTYKLPSDSGSADEEKVLESPEIITNPFFHDDFKDF